MAVTLDFMGEKIAVGILRLTIVSRYPFVFVCLVSKSYIAKDVGTGEDHEGPCLTPRF